MNHKTNRDQSIKKEKQEALSSEEEDCLKQSFDSESSDNKDSLHKHEAEEVTAFNESSSDELADESNALLAAAEKKLADCERQLEKHRDRYLRAEATLQNVRRRAERDVSNAHKFGSEKLLSDLLPVLDSMTRGLESIESKKSQPKLMREGMMLTIDLLRKTLEKHGVELIDPAPGEKFNPDYHEAMSMVSDPDKTPNTIVEVIQKGFQLNGRVLRAAMVIVAQA